MLPQQVLPDDGMAILDLGELEIQRSLPVVGFRASEHAIEKRGVGFVLPMVLEGIEIGGVGF